MSLFGRALGLAPLALDINDERLWSTWPGSESAAGVRVDAETALTVSAFWACVRILSESLGMLPASVFQRLERGRAEVRYHPLWDVLHLQPNASQSAFDFKAMLTAWMLMRGDAYARIVPGPRGPVDQLIPLHPDRVTVQRLPGYRLRYHVRPENGSGPDEILLDDEVFHLRGLSLDGINGLSVLHYARETLGIAKAADGYAGRFFRNDSRPPGVLETAGTLNQQARDNLKQSWEDAHSGVNQHRVALLEQGITYKAIGLAPEDAQMLQTREFQVVDVARWFGVPLFMIQETAKSTSWGSGIEQMMLAFVTMGLAPWVTRWEQAISRDLILYPNKYYVKFNMNALVRGDIAARFASYNTGIMAGMMTRNEARAFEDLNPIDGADELLVPLNMQGIDEEPGEPASEPSEPAPEPSEPPEEQPSEDATQHAAAARPGHYLALLQEAAGRIVRREQAALAKAAKRAGDDATAWRAEVKAFYADYAPFVAATMQMPTARAEDYVAVQLAAVLAGGLAAHDEHGASGLLVGLALEAGDGD